ncbi:MAG: methyltransferase domain-containing protein [Opitutaceae bacterium]|jgi:SAM-dependent methyltransferase|nr:methyltransferase domain-containing protein [Opitutaceae bacterium]NBR58630.1 methyltransferase domain-containing protein [Opitutaceae bacterium]
MDPLPSTTPDFWNSRYLSNQTPWDFGGVPADLKAYLKTHPRGGHVLIPGCGSGYEIKAFVDAGYTVTALDLSTIAIDRARQLIGPDSAQQIFAGDFFQHDFGPTQFDVVYERTFICALLPEQRNAYRDRIAALLKYRGALLGYFYYQTPDLQAGPPFGFAWGTADELFARYFLLVKDTPVTDSLPLFAGHERWQEWHRTSFGATPTSVLK